MTIDEKSAVDCIDRQATLNAIIKRLGIKNETYLLEAERAIYQQILAMPPVTPQETRWIPCSERLPDDLEPVNITWVNHNPESYYAEIKDKPFTATGVYFNGQWYWWSSLCTDILAEYSHNYSDVIDVDIEIIAWQPLPKSYKQEAGG